METAYSGTTPFHTTAKTSIKPPPARDDPASPHLPIDLDLLGESAATMRSSSPGHDGVNRLETQFSHERRKTAPDIERGAFRGSWR